MAVSRILSTVAYRILILVQATTSRSQHRGLAACACHKLTGRTDVATSSWNVLQLDFMDGRRRRRVRMVDTWSFLTRFTILMVTYSSVASRQAVNLTMSCP